MKNSASALLGRVEVTAAAMASCSQAWVDQCLMTHKAMISKYSGVISRSRLVSEYPIDAEEVDGISVVLLVTEGDPRSTKVLLPSEWKASSSTEPPAPR